MRLGRDVNGNKTLKVGSSDFGVGKGFSIQTLGNLPKTHKMDEHCFNESIASSELFAYVKEYGTPKQKEKLGF